MDRFSGMRHRTIRLGNGVVVETWSKPWGGMVAVGATVCVVVASCVAAVAALRAARRDRHVA